MKDLQELVQERLAELFRALKAVIGKHRTLNSVDVLGAAGTVMAKVKGKLENPTEQQGPRLPCRSRNLLKEGRLG